MQLKEKKRKSQQEQVREGEQDKDFVFQHFRSVYVLWHENNLSEEIR